MENIELSKCPRCGNMFHCSRSGKCWCYEVALPVDKLEEIENTYESCLCPSCLKEFANAVKKEGASFETPSPDDIN